MGFITWDPPVKFLFIRYYGLMWIIGLALAYYIVRKLFDDQKIDRRQFDPLFFYCFFGIIIGARLGHCIFYEPEYFLTSFTHVVEMILPIRFTPTGWELTGYAGLASHGGTLGLMLALWLYVRKYKVGIWRLLDTIAIATPITACFIRLGNLMNSEIVGHVTNVPWAFIFVREGPEPRHPAQLYEAIAYLVIFIIGWALYRRHKERVGSGFFFGFCLTTIFIFRFFVEFLKEVQVDFEQGMALDMGQWLSIPFVALGIYCMVASAKKKIEPVLPYDKAVKKKK